MKSFRNLDELAASESVANGDRSRPASLLYASAAADTKVFTFTHPGFLRERGCDGVPDLNLYVLIDRGAPLEEPLTFSDEGCTIAALNHQMVSLMGFPACVSKMSWSDSPRYPDRTFHVVRVQANNEHVSPALLQTEWTPDVFVGVCDGCRMGGNLHCVNQLTTHGLPAELVRHIKLPRWWITDHFDDAHISRELSVGSVVESNEPSFPAAMRKVALLATDWGHYGGHGRSAIGGATLFEVVRR